MMFQFVDCEVFYRTRENINGTIDCVDGFYPHYTTIILLIVGIVIILFGLGLYLKYLENKYKRKNKE